MANGSEPCGSLFSLFIKKISASTHHTLLLPAVRPFTGRSQPQWMMGMLSWNLSTWPIWPTAPPTSTHMHALICLYISVSSNGGLQMHGDCIVWAVCMHAVMINFFWRGEELIFFVTLNAAPWCIVFLRLCSCMLCLCQICLYHMCSALWTYWYLFGRSLHVNGKMLKPSVASLHVPCLRCVHLCCYKSSHFMPTTKTVEHRFPKVFCPSS